MTDPISDMLIRITNAQAVRKETAEIPFSRMKFEIAKILERTGFVKKVELKGKRARKPIDVTLAYENGVPVVRGARRISKPGQRIYASATDAPRAGRKRGLVLVSTSKGLMTAGEAKKLNVGGEVLCELWS
ncbi:MAG: 30S ribosomal protein S8 [Candidatus Wildermuthbacteria bacterium]|nr:30S ribosomal protein S8 [Candidatus Wildermuthbacteria bacterium]